jgi:hypothetical protein
MGSTGEGCKHNGWAGNPVSLIAPRWRPQARYFDLGIPEAIPLIKWASP